MGPSLERVEAEEAYLGKERRVDHQPEEDIQKEVEIQQEVSLG